MYTLAELRKILGLKTIPQARNRYKAIRDVLEARGWVTNTPRSNALAFTPEGVELLKRLEDKIKAGKTLAAAAEELRIELGEKDPPMDAHRIRKLEVSVKQLERDLYRIEHELEERIAALERRRPWWARVLRLAPPKEGEPS